MKKRYEKPEIHEEESAVISPPLQEGFNQTKILSLFFHNKYNGTTVNMQVERTAEFSQIQKNLSRKIGMTFFYLDYKDQTLAGNVTPEDEGIENGDIINITPVD